MENIDFESISLWISDTIPFLSAPYHFDLIAGGRSNLTFLVTDASERLAVLRRPPLSHVLPTAHDMAREFTLISALHPTAVPVPRPIALCSDTRISDRPFYMMEYIKGNVLKDLAATELLYDESQRRNISEQLVSSLAAIHTLDIDQIGLGSLSKKDGYLLRQLERWHTQYLDSAKLNNHEIRLIEEVFEKLKARVPKQSVTSLVHGDFRLDNAIVRDDGHLAAIIDWEIATLGDPLADLGLLMVYWTEPNDSNVPLPSVTALSGFLSRRELVDIYEQKTGFDTSNLEFYIAFGYWKLACILEGVYSRYKSGAQAGDRSDVAELGRQVEILAAKAQETLSN